MLTSSDRSRAQVRIEKLMGYAAKPHEFQSKPAKEKFQQFILPAMEVSELLDDLTEDGRDLFFKGALSFYQGIFDIHHGLYSWAVVKFYYAVFYFLKASLAFRGISIIRCKSLFTLKCQINALPVQRNGRGDHKTVLKIWRATTSEVDDILLANTVDEVETYTWLMDARENIQYKRKHYSEPKIEQLFSDLSLDNLDRQLQLYASDPNAIHSFDPEHACLAIPLKRFLLSFDDLIQKQLNLTENEKLFLYELVRPYFNPNSVIIKPLISSKH